MGLQSSKILPGPPLFTRRIGPKLGPIHIPRAFCLGVVGGLIMDSEYECIKVSEFAVRERNISLDRQQPMS